MVRPQIRPGGGLEGNREGPVGEQQEGSGTGPRDAGPIACALNDSYVVCHGCTACRAPGTGWLRDELKVYLSFIPVACEKQILCN